MKINSFTLILIGILFLGCNNNPKKETLLKIEFHLSNFGVETLSFPQIDGQIDFTHQTSTFKTTYDSPGFTDSTYSLSKKEIKQLEQLIQNTDLRTLKEKYTLDRIPDQPRSVMTITTTDNEYKIDDYGLRGEKVLEDIYNIVYKF